jgi:lysozyme family protein
LSKRFDAMMPFIFKWEGETYENDPDDPGGPTKYGIDSRSHPGVDIRRLTKEDASAIYYKDYWLRYRCEGYAFKLGECIFNCAVNCGIGRVNKILATGAKTATDFLDEQEAFYRRLVVARPKSQKYLKGWLNRTNALRRLLAL